MARDFNDDNQRRYQGRDGNDQFGRHGESWDDSYSSGRQHGGYPDRAYGQQPQQNDFNRYGGQGRGNDFGSDYGSSRYGGPGASTYGGYGGGQQYQDDRSAWNRQQQGFDHGSGARQAGGGYGRDDYPAGYGNQQYDAGYGLRPQGERHGRDRYSEGFYGDASRFAHGGLGQDGRSQGTRYDPDYEQWRNEQLRNLDNDYESWRGERYKKFSDDFNTWRSNRSRDSDMTTSSRSGNASGSTSGSGTSSTSAGSKSKDQS